MAKMRRKARRSRKSREARRAEKLRKLYRKFFRKVMAPGSVSRGIIMAYGGDYPRGPIDPSFNPKAETALFKRNIRRYVADSLKALERFR